MTGDRGRLSKPGCRVWPVKAMFCNPVFLWPLPLASLSNRSHPALTPSLSIFQGNIVDSTATALIDGMLAKIVF